jgi:hypothetical protein
MSRTEARVAVEAELRVLNLTKPMTAKQLELFCNDVCERLSIAVDRGPEPLPPTPELVGV